MSDIKKDFEEFRRQQRIKEKYNPLSVSDIILEQKKEEQRKRDKEASMTDADRIRLLQKQKKIIEKELRELTQDAISNGNAGIGTVHMADYSRCSAWIRRFDERNTGDIRGDRVNLIICDKRKDIGHYIDLVVRDLTELKNKIQESE